MPDIVDAAAPIPLIAAAPVVNCVVKLAAISISPFDTLFI
jgi:hypothetical protein